MFNGVKYVARNIQTGCHRPNENAIRPQKQIKIEKKKKTTERFFVLRDYFLFFKNI
jgi:hypothetical protein